MLRCKKCNCFAPIARILGSGYCGKCWNEIKRAERRAIIDAEEKKQRIIREEEEKKQRIIREEEERLMQERIKNRQKELINKIKAIDEYKIEIQDCKLKKNPVHNMEEIKYSNVTPKGMYPNFVVIDVETTGLHLGRDKIIEISAVKYEKYYPIETFSTLINPKKEIAQDVTEINGITNEMVLNKPIIDNVLPSFDKFIDGYDLVGHNLQFDLEFIYKAGSKFMESKRKYLCTYMIAKKILKKPKYYSNEYYGDYNYKYHVENYKLETIAHFFNILYPIKHRSLFDCFVTGEVFIRYQIHKQHKVDVEDLLFYKSEFYKDV